MVATNRNDTRAEALLERSRQLEGQAAGLRESEEELEQRARALAMRELELQRARDVLKAEAEQLATTSLYKSQFLASMSHELRTPLNSMLILSKMLCDNAGGNLTAKQASYAEIIHSSGNDMLTLIDEVLDLCKMEARTMPVDLGEVDIRAIAEHCDRTQRPLAEQRGLAFSILVDPDVPHHIHTDARRLQQVLKNLLSNAFKFTERGGVQVTVRRASDGGEDGDAGVVVAFSVRDTGIGISREKHRMIFEAFQQADGTTGRRYGGTGLGLSICREVARLLGGEIRLDSEPGVGSTFTLLLPARAKQTPRRGVTAPDGVAAIVGTDRVRPSGERRGSLQGRNILIVDDDPRNVYALGSVLEHHGIAVLRAENGKDGILTLQNVPGIDAVLMDVMMPEMDGYETMRAIRRTPEFARLPIIAITAQAMKGDREKCLESGASDYMSKPVDIDLLLRLLRLWIQPAAIL